MGQQGGLAVDGRAVTSFDLLDIGQRSGSDPTALDGLLRQVGLHDGLPGQARKARVLALGEAISGQRLTPQWLRSDQFTVLVTDPLPDPLVPTALLNPRAPFLDEPEMARTLTDPSPAVLLDITKLAVSFAVAAIDLEDSLGEETLRVLEHGERSPGEREALRSRLARLHTETDRQAMRTQARSTSGTGVYADAPYAVISWDTIHSAMYNGLLPCSGAEAAILRIALSLAEGHPVDLGPAIIRLDKRNLMYVLAAIRHAGGDRSSWGTIPQDTP